MNQKLKMSSIGKTQNQIPSAITINAHAIAVRIINYNEISRVKE